MHRVPVRGAGVRLVLIGRVSDEGGHEPRAALAVDINECAYDDVRVEHEVDRYVGVSELFAALASPVRSAAVHRLTERGCTVTELAHELGISQPLMSQHLRVLRSARVVRATRTGRTTTYTLLDEHVAHVFLDAYSHTEESDHD